MLSFLLFSGLIAGIRNLLSASHSRGNEYEADELGCKIAAMACFDTLKASEVMRKMNETVAISPSTSVTTTKANSNHTSLASLFSTHPPTMDRYLNLTKLAKDEEYSSKYSHCRTLREKLNHSLQRLSTRG